MKKQNVKNKLAFNKVAVTELNDNQLAHVNGGSSLMCITFITYLITRELQ